MHTRSHDSFGIGVLLCVLCLVSLVAPAGAQLWNIEPADGDAVIGAAAGDQTDPYIERGGDIFLAVWVDERTTVPGDVPEYATERDVYAVRLDSTGDPIETTPLVLSDDIADQYGVRACWNGSNWLVTWTSRTPAPDHPYYPHGLEAVRVSPDGEVLDETPFLVYPSPVGSVEYLATESDGTDWIVFLSETVQSGMNQYTYLKGARISPSGALLGTPVTMFSPSCCYFFPLGTDVAYANGQFLVVFECIPSIYVNDAICGMRFTQSLSSIDTYPFEIAGTNGIFREPLVATDGTDFLVGWYYYPSGTYPPTQVDPYCARVTAGGVSLDPDGIDLSAGSGSGVARKPRVAWDGTNWLTVWPDDDGARVARVTTGGSVLDPGGVSFPGLGVNDLTEVPNGVRAVWADEEAGGVQPNDVHTTRITGDLVADPEVAVSLGAPSHVHVDVAMGATDAMLIFRSDISGAHQILAQPASEYGATTKANPVELASGPFLTDPEIAWNGSLYLAVWSDEGSDRIAGCRILPDGTVLDDPPISVMDGLDPDVAAVGDDFLVVATDEVGTPTSRKPFGVRVRGADGVVLDPTPILLGDSYARVPKVAGMVSRWIVAWEERPAYDSESSEVWAAFVDTDGTTPGKFDIATNQATSEYHYAPAVASGLAIAAIVWEDTRLTHGEDWNLYARRVRVDGVVYDDPDGFEVAAGPLDERNAAVGWNGSTFQVAYEETEQIEWFDHSTPDVHGTRFDQNGAVLDPPGFAIEKGDNPEVLPSVTGGGSESLVALSVFVPDAPYASYRLVLRTLEDGTTGVPEDQAVESEMRLGRAFPNPARTSTTIRFTLPERANVSLRIYDVAGRLVRSLVDEMTPKGEHEAVWDGLDDSRNEVAGGLYLYRMDAGGYSGTGKLVLIR